MPASQTDTIPPSHQFETALSAHHACLPVHPYVSYKYPLALDLLYHSYTILCSAHTFESLTHNFAIAPTCRIHLFGATGYFTTDPENVHAILSTRFEDYGLGTRSLAMHPLLGAGIHTQDGKSWKRSREVLKRMFGRVGRDVPGVFAGHVEGLVERIRKGSVDGRVDLKPLMFEYTLNTTTALLFGELHSSMSKEQHEVVAENFDVASFGCGIRLRLADAAFLYQPKEFREACKAVREWATFFADKAMKYKDDNGEDAAAERYPFIIDLWREMGDVGLVRDQLLHVLVAGRDSTASLLCWTL
jgi:cytochrome P450